MATYSPEEDRRIEFLLQIYRRYSWIFKVLIVVFLLSFCSYRAWQWHRARKSAEALSYYSLLQSAVAQKNFQQATQALDYLQEHFPTSSYTYLGIFLFSQYAVHDHQPEKALSSLAWIQHGGDQLWTSLAIFRAVPIAIDLKRYSYAHQLLDGFSVPLEFKPLYLLSQGDVAVAEKYYERARHFYQQAQSAMEEQSSQNLSRWGMRYSPIEKNFQDLLKQRVRYLESIS